jgi:hypothetical protein
LIAKAHFPGPAGDQFDCKLSCYRALLFPEGTLHNAKDQKEPTTKRDMGANPDVIPLSTRV